MFLKFVLDVTYFFVPLMYEDVYQKVVHVDLLQVPLREIARGGI